MTFATRPLFYVNTGGVQTPIPLSSPISFAGGGGGTSILEIQFGTNGVLTRTVTDDGGSTSTTTNWYSPPATGVSTGYYARLTVNSGTGPNGSPTSPAATWLDLGSERIFKWEQASAGTLNANITLEIATDSGGVSVIATVTGVSITLTKP